MGPTNDEIRRRWRQTVVSADKLQAVPNQAGVVDGLATGFFGSLEGRRVYVKPRKLNPGVAAREKICSDLATDLGVPVPPVVLVVRDGPTDEASHCAASLVMHKHQLSWSQIDPSTTAFRFQRVEQLLADLPVAGARAVVFDTWVDQIDHNSTTGNHNIISGFDAHDAIGAIVLLDYQLALGAPQGWTQAQVSEVAVASLPLSLIRRADRGEIETTLSKLEALEDDRVRDAVTRIPQEFLSPEEGMTILNGLLARKKMIRAALQSLLRGGQ